MQSVTSNQTCGGEQSFTKSCAGSQSFTKSCGEECIICDGCCESIERDSRDHDHMITDENGELWFCDNCSRDGRAKFIANKYGVVHDWESDPEWKLREPTGEFIATPKLYEQLKKCYYADPIYEGTEEDCERFCSSIVKDMKQNHNREQQRLIRLAKMGDADAKTLCYASLTIQRAWRKYFVSIKASDFRDQLVECEYVTYEQMELISDEKLREAVESSCVLQNYTFTDVWENSIEVLFDVLEELVEPEESESELDEDGYPYDRCDKCGEILPRDFDWITRPNGRCYDCVPECETNDDEDDVGCDTDAECTEP